MSLKDVIGIVKTSFSADPAIKLERQREILTRLKFIGTVGPGEKIDVRGMKVESNSLFTPLKRLLNGESRDTTHGFISATIERSFEILSVYVHSDKKSDSCTAANIVKDLLAAVSGLKNIQRTYKDDKLFVCNLETIIEGINSRLTELKDTHGKLFVTQAGFFDPPEEQPTNKKSK